ncbi:His/Gly/Thr/Pro-type tRNA ligase C-terminal domain-containing protein [Natronospira sp.]|uniref:His/Gly/Thr/Pro-type tRNA ligase C-terminal domain-containing protein n=1 Tax=Natronospira sp. TaxID=2024970 RepID=UPI0038734D3F
MATITLQGKKIHTAGDLPAVGSTAPDFRLVAGDFSDRSLKALMRRADRLGATYVLLVGDDELSGGAANLRHMGTKEQVAITIDNFVENIKRQIGASDDS